MMSDDIHADAIDAIVGTPVEPEVLDGASKISETDAASEPDPVEAPGPDPATISQADHDAMVGQVAALQARLRDLEGRQSEHARDIESRDARHDEAERQYKATVLERDLYAAMADHEILPGVADQIAILLRDGLEVVEDGDVLATRAKNGKPIREHMAEILSLPKFNHFLKPTGGGGSGSSGTDLGDRRPAQRTPDDEAFESYRQRKAELDRQGYAGFGLGRTTRLR